MIKRFKRKQEHKRFYRTNERIRALSVRVLDSLGKQIGVMPSTEALKKAREENLDLVEIAPAANPPVVKIIDFNKFLYQEEKKKKEEKKKAKTSETKEIRLGPFMNDHDLEVMTKRGEEFLKDNNKVRLVVKFRGRQITHPEFGRNIIDKLLLRLKHVSKVDRDPYFERSQLIAVISPEKKKRLSP
ncbi:translation initiation factor IF-3 [Patescibacteria group bacterium]|nr:translation initiation factor IF-3 [Patescibacteria group bacterium]